MVPAAAFHSASAGFRLCLQLAPVLRDRNRRASCPRQKAPTHGPAVHRPSPVRSQSFRAAGGILRILPSAGTPKGILRQNRETTASTLRKIVPLHTENYLSNWVQNRFSNRPRTGGG